ncbi:hypothetical protein Tco_1413231 [Tanacetum coccineum]
MVSKLCSIITSQLLYPDFIEVQIDPYEGDGLSFKKVREGRLATRFCLDNLLMFLKLRWDNLLCHSQFTLLDALAKKHVLLSSL